MAKKITEDIFMERITKRFTNEHFLIMQYYSMSSPLKIKCLKCGKIIETPQAKNFLAKNKIAGCSDCNGFRAKNNKNINKVKEKYQIISQKKDQKGKTWYTCKCRICGRISTHLLVSFLQNTCRCQGNGNRWTEQEFKNKLYNQFNNEYTMLSQFKTVNDKSLFKHSCGFIWSTTPAHILYNQNGCPKCCKKESKGCKIIEAQLKKLNLIYEKEKFLNNSLQRFDFYLEFQNKKYAIEYNGEQHYKYNPFFHGRDFSTFKKYQERDLKKSQYCKNNDITLITIPYTMSNEQIKQRINKIFYSSTTSSQNVVSSETKKCPSS